MFQRLILGNKLVKLEEVDSTNTYLQKVLTLNPNEIEGVVITTINQYQGKGQRGNEWNTKSGENLTFSILLKPNLLIQHQFLISKVISLGIVDFLNELGLKKIKIKWPNDIYCGDNKIAGILIENTIRKNNIYNSIVGIGLNVNQLVFDTHLKNPTSLLKELACKPLNLDEVLNQILFFIEKRYLALKSNKIGLINSAYLNLLYRLKETAIFKINDVVIEAKIVGVNENGKLQLSISNELKEFDLKEISFLI